VRDGATHARLGPGDLARTLGVRAAPVASEPAQLLPIDVIDLTLDGDLEIVCVAHTVVGSLLRSPLVIAIMNAAFVGALNLAPRAHPGDGLADVVTMRLSLPDRFKARRRMTTATHLPHPNITTRRLDHGTLDLGGPRSVRVDGHRVGRASRIDFVVRGDGITVGV
jgi:hypothetical protein